MPTAVGELVCNKTAARNNKCVIHSVEALLVYTTTRRVLAHESEIIVFRGRRAYMVWYTCTQPAVRYDSPILEMGELFWGHHTFPGTWAIWLAPWRGPGVPKCLGLGGGPPFGDGPSVVSLTPALGSLLHWHSCEAPLQTLLGTPPAASLKMHPHARPPPPAARNSRHERKITLGGDFSPDGRRGAPYHTALSKLNVRLSTPSPPIPGSPLSAGYSRLNGDCWLLPRPPLTTLYLSWTGPSQVSRRIEHLSHTLASCIWNHVTCSLRVRFGHPGS